MKHIAVCKWLLLLLLLLGLLSISVPVFAQSGGSYSLTWSTIDGGGATSAGGAYTLTGTAGQPDAYMSHAGGIYALAGGFWGSVAGKPDLHLPFIVR